MKPLPVALARPFLSGLLALIGLVAGCATAPVANIPDAVPEAIQEQKTIRLFGGPQDWLDTGLRVAPGHYITMAVAGKISRTGGAKPDVIASSAKDLVLRIGEKGKKVPFKDQDIGYPVPAAGKLLLMYSPMLWPSGDMLDPTDIARRWQVGHFDIHITVWKRYDPAALSSYFQDASKKKPWIGDFVNYAAIAQRENELFQAERLAQNQVEKTREALAETSLKGVETRDEEQAKTIAGLTEKLKKAEQTQKDLEVLRRKDEEQRAREKALQARLLEAEESRRVLAAQRTKEAEAKDTQRDLAEMTERLRRAEQAQKELAELKQRMEEQRKVEREILDRLKMAEENRGVRQKLPPMIALANLQDGMQVDVEAIACTGAVESDTGVAKIELLLNQRPVPQQDQRGVHLVGKASKRAEFSARIRLREGENEITIVAQDQDGLTARKTVGVRYAKKRQTIWAAVIGISRYKHIPSLKYANRDAQEFYRFLTDVNGVPKEHVWLLLDEEATLPRIRSLLGTQLRRNAGKDDLVIIYVAGHGATERDPGSRDGDGLEKYILPSEVDPRDYYATALPMEEVARILGRISSERLVFIGDTCYSGASGGRTVPVSGTRSNVSNAFLERLSQGKGRIILTASDANEVSLEKDELRHGVFTYYLLEGLRGAADFDGDGIVTVDDAYRYVSIKVPQATGQDQHPVRKGESTGEIVLGILK